MGITFRDVTIAGISALLGATVATAFRESDTPSVSTLSVDASPATGAPPPNLAEPAREPDAAEQERIRAENQADHERRVAEAEARRAAAEARGAWRASSNRSEIDDSTNHYLSVQADRDVLPGTWQAARPQLTIRCVENTTALVIDVGAYIGIDETYVTLRIDDQQPETRSLRISTNYEAFGFWNGGSSIPYIRRLLEAERLTVRITPYGENAQTFTFPVKGLQNVIGPVREECGW